MNNKPPESWSLGRWSRLKREATRESGVPVAPPAAAASPAITAAPPAAIAGAPQSANPAETLPPVESLTIDSDFSAFLQPKVDEALKRQALKQLFRDPRFNVMDGLDVYVGDYSQPDPIDPDVVRQMVQGRYIFDPPPTRINAQGFAEDVPAEELAAARGEAIESGDPSADTREPVVALASLPAGSIDEAPSTAAAAPDSGSEPPSSPASDGPEPRPR